MADNIPKECKLCSKLYIPINKNSRYCSKQCRKKANRLENGDKYRKNERKRYLETKEQKRANYRKYYEKNKERLRKESCIKAKRDIKKNICRSETRRIIKLNEELKKRIIPMEMGCKICGTTENLEIHHEEYPKGKSNIINSILNNKIYFLCSKHHGQVRWKDGF